MEWQKWIWLENGESPPMLSLKVSSVWIFFWSSERNIPFFYKPPISKALLLKWHKVSHLSTRGTKREPRTLIPTFWQADDRPRQKSPAAIRQCRQTAQSKPVSSTWRVRGPCKSAISPSESRALSLTLSLLMNGGGKWESAAPPSRVRRCRRNGKIHSETICLVMLKLNSFSTSQF